METEITSRTGKKYLLKPNENGGWKVIRQETGSEEIVSDNLIRRTRTRLEAGEEIPFRKIDYTVAKETAVVNILKDLINVDHVKKTYSLKGSSPKKATYSWEIINRNVVLKYLDTSLYSQGTAVPIELYSFFELDDMDFGEKGKIHFYRGEKLYTCRKQTYQDRTGIRIFWDSDLKKDIKKEFKDIFHKLSNDQGSNSTFSKDGYLRFEKIKDNIHISIISHKEVENDIESLKIEDGILSKYGKSEAYLFTRNPKRWKWTDLPQAITEANGEGEYITEWTCRSHKKIKVGDRAFLVRLGVRPKGIIGAGLIVSKPFKKPHYNLERAERGDQVYKVRIRFDLLMEEPIITEEELRSGGLGQHNNWFPESSGVPIPERIANLLENRLNEITGVRFIPPTQDEISDIRYEGRTTTRTVTTYEKDSIARSQCLDHYGTNCQVCNLSFQDFYGDIGTDYIEVHHIVPLSDIPGEHPVDPIKDLIPLCPNCHRMTHKRKPPYSIEELRKIIRIQSS